MATPFAIRAARPLAVALGVGAALWSAGPVSAQLLSDDPEVAAALAEPVDLGERLDALIIELVSEAYRSGEFPDGLKARFDAAFAEVDHVLDDADRALARHDGGELADACRRSKAHIAELRPTLSHNVSMAQAMPVNTAEQADSTAVNVTLFVATYGGMLAHYSVASARCILSVDPLAAPLQTA